MKKFTWIFGLALLWGGLNAVAQTEKKVGTFADLKKAVENIPVFGEVEKKRELYTPLKEKYEAAVEADQKAQNALTTATTTYNTYLNGDYKLAKDAVDNFQGEKESTKTTWVVDYENADENGKAYFREFANFREALNALPTENLDEKMWWGFYTKGTSRFIIFVRDEIKKRVIESNLKPIGYNTVIQGGLIEWSENFVTPDKLSSDGDTYWDLLDEFKTSADSKTYNPNYGVFYYEEPNVNVDETSEDYGNIVLRAMQFKLDRTDVENTLGAFEYTYDNLKKTYYKSVKTTETTKEYQDVLDALATAEETLAGYDKAKTDAEKDAEEKAKALTDAKTAKDDAVKAFNDVAKAIAKDDPAQYDEDHLIVCEPQYTTIEITNSFEITDKDYATIAGATITNLWNEWPADYTLEGNGYSINSKRTLFKINNGTIENLANISGSIATSISNTGAVYYCLTRNNATTLRAYKSKEVENYENYSNKTVEDVIYEISRGGFPFGYKAEAGKIQPLTDDTRLYAAQYTNAEYKDKGIYQFKLNITDEGPKWNKDNFKAKFKSEVIADNSILYIDIDKMDDEDTYASTLMENKKVKNVAVKVNDGGYTCYNAVVKDGTGAKEFYVPKDFTATELSYNRDFKSTSDLATVCLPFSVPIETLKTKGVTKIMQFDYVETATNTYWFRYQNEDTQPMMKANEPYVLKCNGENFEGGEIFGELSNIEVAATKVAGTTEDINPLAVKPSNDGKGAEFRGVFVATNASALSNGDKLYGFGEGLFRPLVISEGTKFSPFRTYIRASRESNVPAVTFNIGELDEDGNIVSDGGETGVTTAVKEADAFSVKGINGALVITSDKAQKVNVYTIGGSLVKAANVEAGTVTVPVAAGVYVVNGKKVFVK